MEFFFIRYHCGKGDAEFHLNSKGSLDISSEPARLNGCAEEMTGKYKEQRVNVPTWSQGQISM